MFPGFDESELGKLAEMNIQWFELFPDFMNDFQEVDLTFKR